MYAEISVGGIRNIRASLETRVHLEDQRYMVIGQSKVARRLEGAKQEETFTLFYIMKAETL